MTRYPDYDEVKKQMHKIHKPHRESGYLKGTVDFRDTVDENGQSDWEMVYTPGPKAYAEFQAFNRKGQGGVSSLSQPPSQGIEIRAEKVPFSLPETSASRPSRQLLIW